MRMALFLKGGYHLKRHSMRGLRVNGRISARRYRPGERPERGDYICENVTITT